MMKEVIKRLLRALQLEKHAGKDATSGVPVGGIIPDIVEAAKREGRERLDDLENHCREAEANTLGMQKAARDAAAGMDSPNYGVAPPDSEVEIARKKYKGAAANFNKFKHDNGIERDAGGDDRLEQIGWAVFIVIIEGALNSFFFAPVVEGGLIGGFFIAFCIGFINVAFAFIGGAWGLRYGIHHCKPHLKMGGLAIFALCTTVCAMVVLLSSYLRAHVGLLEGRNDADFSKLLDMAWAASVQDLMQMNWERLISSLHSFLLLFIGTLCAFLGFWKGHAFDDYYPGFGKMHRLLEDAKDELEHVQDEYNNNLTKWRNNKNGTLNKVLNDMEQGYLKAQTAVDAMNGKSKDAADLPADMQRLAQTLLNRYHNRYQTISPVPIPPPDAIDGAPFDALADEYRKHAQTAEEIEKQFKDAKKSYLRTRDIIERKLGAGDRE